MKNRLFILVEGEDDVRFFGRIIKPLFVCRYDSVEIVPYACIKREKVNNFIKSIEVLRNDYILVTDMDNAHSIMDKKQLLYFRFSNIRDGAIVVVIQEIESWYYAGHSTEAAQNLGARQFSSTDDTTKEDFNQLIPRRFDTQIDFMYEILKYYSIGTAAQTNRSFNFFASRYRSQLIWNWHPAR